MSTSLLHALPPLASEVFITAELARRPPKRTDYLQEKLALQDLATRMADNPGEVLPRFVELAMQVTGGVSAGLSLYEEEPAPGAFRWHFLCGSLAAFEGATTPRHDSPCGVTLDQAAPILARHAERLYKWIADANIVVPEVLLVPLFLGGPQPLGTLWVVSEVEGRFAAGFGERACARSPCISGCPSLIGGVRRSASHYSPSASGRRRSEAAIFGQGPAIRLR
jgi:hypothetical protein